MDLTGGTDTALNLCGLPIVPIIEFRVFEHKSMEVFNYLTKNHEFIVYENGQEQRYELNLRVAENSVYYPVDGYSGLLIVESQIYLVNRSDVRLLKTQSSSWKNWFKDEKWYVLSVCGFMFNGRDTFACITSDMQIRMFNEQKYSSFKLEGEGNAKITFGGYIRAVSAGEGLLLVYNPFSNELILFQIDAELNLRVIKEIPLEFELIKMDVKLNLDGSWRVLMLSDLNEFYLFEFDNFNEIKDSKTARINFKTFENEFEIIKELGTFPDAIMKAIAVNRGIEVSNDSLYHLLEAAKKEKIEFREYLNQIYEESMSYFCQIVQLDAEHLLAISKHSIEYLCFDEQETMTDLIQVDSMAVDSSFVALNEIEWQDKTFQIKILNGMPVDIQILCIQNICNLMFEEKKKQKLILDKAVELQIVSAIENWQELIYKVYKEYSIYEFISQVIQNDLFKDYYLSLDALSGSFNSLELIDELFGKEEFLFAKFLNFHFRNFPEFIVENLTKLVEPNCIQNYFLGLSFIQIGYEFKAKDLFLSFNEKEKSMICEYLKFDDFNQEAMKNFAYFGYFEIAAFFGRIINEKYLVFIYELESKNVERAFEAMMNLEQEETRKEAVRMFVNFLIETKQTEYLINLNFGDLDEEVVNFLWKKGSSQIGIYYKLLFGIFTKRFDFQNASLSMLNLALMDGIDRVEKTKAFLACLQSLSLSKEKYLIFKDSFYEIIDIKKLYYQNLSLLYLNQKFPELNQSSSEDLIILLCNADLFEIALNVAQLEEINLEIFFNQITKKVATNEKYLLDLKKYLEKVNSNNLYLSCIENLLSLNSTFVIPPWLIPQKQPLDCLSILLKYNRLDDAYCLFINHSHKHKGLPVHIIDELSFLISDWDSEKHQKFMQIVNERI
ncbi:hypothetical protein ROZALSC1DRAFT_29506 [Rozella allomycis CSF55]|uniref:NUP160 middle TPR domain-containing protein n=1 Tax=Rozella allomycis (strain CSF55) TaxID=988480 RepID=A0A4P9YHR6_ROZAC|nr:hypothetical protein ROZALSC1DRAFT_29506 [Rozella allomycis CSF55]